MTQEEYENALGKLVLLKAFMTQPHQDKADDLIEDLTAEYIERMTRNEL